jgi:hypothetical protein
MKWLNYLVIPIGVAAGLHEDAIGIELSRRAPCVGEYEERPDRIRTWRVERRMRGAIVRAHLQYT